MNEQEMQWLVQQLLGTAEVLGQQLSPTAAAIMADDLRTYTKPVLARALSRVRNEHAGRLTPKAILDRIDDAMGRPSANEAWAIASTALDERTTVVWTNEIMDAWSAAKPLAEARDMIGARMAFIAAYERIVRNARDLKTVPVVHVSIGWDGESRNTAIEKALALGYITPEHAAREMTVALPAPVFNPIALLTGRVEPAPVVMPSDVRAKLDALRADLAKSGRRKDALKRMELMQWRRQKQTLDAQIKQRLSEGQS